MRQDDRSDTIEMLVSFTQNVKYRPPGCPKSKNARVSRRRRLKPCRLSGVHQVATPPKKQFSSANAQSPP